VYQSDIDHFLARPAPGESRPQRKVTFFLTFVLDLGFFAAGISFSSTVLCSIIKQFKE
jgi:hypothetical protein